jgi:hypothetical protein
MIRAKLFVPVGTLLQLSWGLRFLPPERRLFCLGIVPPLVKVELVKPIVVEVPVEVVVVVVVVVLVVVLVVVVVSPVATCVAASTSTEVKSVVLKMESTFNSWVFNREPGSLNLCSTMVTSVATAGNVVRMEVGAVRGLATRAWSRARAWAVEIELTVWLVA